MRPRTLLVATHNPGKLVELRQALSDLPLTILDLGSFPGVTPIAETGRTFAENASLKASGYATQTRLLTLADDSGLEVDALNGAPGVLSSRYGRDGDSDADRTLRLLNDISKARPSNRFGRFVSVIAIATEAGDVISLSTGTCEGQIAESPKGTSGFGYDPIFIPQGFRRTFAELSTDVKNQISHRGRALVQACEFLRALTLSPDAG